ncbi:acetyl-CoA carboxylase biotin carboxylase subunit [Mycolicibacterium thermoresistibile]|uniref:acetyl-CoA carboxylase biotin carboxylase subunit n=1 Tax=Mycolicibacterium thermoresistibile TaxID=1797 RepID=UPI000681821E|nr:acetyl-CoA carboxylase biotin carboxylase subunit [Mycolicibacterium thermoresistibile]MCV7191112.1 acetyl-CoA carboxylase biotin carboxylase subunit [Mycolicibacterium thermoresistibile]SNW16909.1 acetyl-/propionyl-coenzyme A carboxylase subunit alpha [Mycolicibacterium thermoresistibile]
MTSAAVAATDAANRIPVAARIRRVLVANRGEIALRVVRAARAIGLETVVVTSDADRDQLAAQLADRAVCIGGASAATSYLNIDAVLAAAVGTGCDAVHPGYGFLSENPEFARRCEEEGLIFIGPDPRIVAATGDKAAARDIAANAGVPVLTGSSITESPEAAVAAAGEVGFPVLIKAVAGGGGRGMSVVADEAELRRRLPTAIAEATAAFGDGRIYLERFIARARHIEVQVIGDKHGSVVHVGERDCSAQRRHQKVLEEGPAPGLSDTTRAGIHAAAVRFAQAIQLDSAGTVEFIYDSDTGEFAFLEFNARIQVEHPVSEMISGIDLVAEQIRVAAGLPLSFGQNDVQLSGHAIEARIMAESPERGFAPAPGTVTVWQPPSGIGIRVDSHCRPGTVISPYYDSMIAKVIAHAPTRDQAIDRLLAALTELRVEGVSTTIPFNRFLLQGRQFRDGRMTTRWIDDEGIDEFRQNFKEAT